MDKKNSNNYVFNSENSTSSSDFTKFEFEDISHFTIDFDIFHADQIEIVTTDAGASQIHRFRRPKEPDYFDYQ